VCAFGRFEGGFRGGSKLFDLPLPQPDARPVAVLLDEDHAGRFEDGAYLLRPWRCARLAHRTVRRFSASVGRAVDAIASAPAGTILAI
jgi:hypothetical protein